MTPKKYLIVLHNDHRGAWRFVFQGPRLPWWKRKLISIVGWTVTEQK